MKLIILILGVVTMIATVGCESEHEEHRENRGGYYGDEHGYGYGYHDHNNPDWDHNQRYYEYH